MNQDLKEPAENGNAWIVLGCLLAAIAVACGALGAHWVEKQFEARQQELWATASRYLMYHALGMLAVGLVRTVSNKQRKIVGVLMLVGVGLFSGCLYGYVLTDVKPLVHIVPLGGMSLIASWLCFAWFTWKYNAAKGA